MPGIEDLNFKVLLDDELFRAKINEDISRANNLNAKLSDILNLKVPSRQIISDKSVKNSEDLAKNLEEIKKAIEGMPNSVKIVTSGQMEHKDAVEQTNTALSGTEGLMRTIAQLTGVAFSVATIRRFVSELVTVTGQFEVQKMALGSMLQDLDKADEIFSELRKNALNSPYTFQDLTKFAKQLTAFNIPTDQLVETEKRLADVAAGLGVDMGRIILAYGQVKAAGALKGQELRQFTEAGVPILEQLAKQIEEVEHRTVSLSEVFQRVSKKQISFEMVEEAFRRMTSEGGKFYNMQEVLVNTLQGKIGKLRDVWQQALYDMGMNNEELLKGAVDAVTKIVANLDELGRRIPELITMWGAYKTTQMAVEAASGAFSLANHKVLASLKAIGTWISKNPYALLAAAIVAAIFEAKRFYDEIHAGQKRLESAIKENDKELDKEIQKLDELKAKLELAGRGTKEWQDAKDSVVASYGKYFDGLDNEITKVGNLSTAYSTLKTNIEEAIRLRQYTAFEENERKILEDTMSGSLGKIRDRLYKKYSRAEAYTVMTELEQSLRTPGATYASFMQNERVSKIFKRGDYIGDIRQIFESEKAARKTYLDNVRALIKEYGLQGTAVDIDFVGPLPMSATNEKTSTTKTWGDATKKDREIKERISDIQREVQILERYLNQRKEAEKYLGEGASAWMASLVEGKDAEYFATLEKQISDLVAELKTLGDAGNDAADAINGRLGADALTVGLKGLKAEAKAAADAQKAIDKYIDALEKWTNKEKPMEGEGVAYKIGKAIADYRTAIAEAEKKYKDVTTMAGSNSVGNMQALLNMGRDQNAARANLRTTVLGNIRPFIKEMLEQEGYDLTNWNDKTLWQINEIREALSKIELPEWIKKLLESSNLTDILNEAEEKLEEEGDNIDNNTLSPEALKKIGKVSKYAAKEVAGLASSFRDLGEATGNDMLNGLADGIDSLSGALSSIASGASQGGAIGAFVGLLTFMASHFFKLWADEERKAAEATEKYTRALLEADVAYKKVMADAATSANTAFGSDALGSLRKQMEYAEQYREYLMYFIDNWKSMPDLYSRYAGEGGNVDWQRLLADINAGVILEDTPALEEFKRNIEGIISAEEALKSTTEELFGDLASSLADQFIANFKSMGNAVDDFGDTFENLGETILNSLLQSYIIENILKKYEAEANSSLAKYANGQMTPDEYAAWLDGFADNVRMESEALAPAINGLIGAFADRGLLGMDSETTDSLGSGIKSITEETASLLASYINAMRADLSFMRGLQERGWGSVELIGQAIPTLNDYMNQVAANTFDTAQNTQQILSELQSVIGAEGTSGSIVRVQMA